MASKGSILVVGGGISGLTAAVEAAEVGYDVHLIEKGPYLGGRVSRLNQYFPKLCPPTCGLEINFRRVRQNPRITTHTLTEVDGIAGKPGSYDVTLKTSPRYVNDNCTACNACAEVCPEERNNDFNYDLDKSKAIYLPHQMAYPLQYVVDGGACKGTECNKCVEACKYDAIDLEMKASKQKINVGAIVIATGWKPYNARNLENLGGGELEDVITNVEMERLAAENGPTGGKILRPSDGKEITKIAFVQCAGSRDENHLPYCSGICCLASLKQVTFVREQHPKAEIFMFYIDVRAPGRNETFYAKVGEYENLKLRKGKVAKITREEDGMLTLEAEDTATGVKTREQVEMVVLATGMQPSIAERGLPSVSADDNGFVGINDGIIGAGCALHPVDVSTAVKDGTAAALKAIQTIVGRAQ